MADYSHRDPIETTNAVIGILHAEWDGLADATRGELKPILTAYRAALYQAAGDISRGTVMIGLPFALEAAPLLPPDALMRLKADHRSKVSGRLLLFGSQEARRFIQQLDTLIGSSIEPVPAPAPAADIEAFPDAVALARSVISRLNDNWSWLSLRDQDHALVWLRSYDDGLARATDDTERLLATYEFLRLIKQDDDIYDVVKEFFTIRGHLGSTVFGAGVVMTAQDASRIRNLIDRNPMAAVPKTPWPAPTASSAESSPPPLLPQPPIETGKTTLQPEVVNYHTDVRFPGQVSTFDRAIPLRVRLTLEKAAGTVVDAGVSVEFVTPEPQPVQVICNAEGFVEETGDLTRTILVYQGRDSQPAIFLLTPEPNAGSGVRRISLDFHHRGRPAGTANFEVEVRDRPPVAMTPARVQPLIEEKTGDGAETAAVTGGIVLGAANLEPPDFELRIALSADRRTLTYTLHSPAGWQGMVHKPMGSIRLSVDNPRALLENTLSRLSGMSRMAKDRRSAQDTDHNRFEIRQIGTFLYETLFTDELRQAYREMRNVRIEQEKAGKSVSLLVLSDEPWIPWEMIRPYENDLTNEDFLCDQFRLTRWLAGRGLPDNFSLGMAQIVVPASNLEAVKQEQDYFLKTVPAKYPSITVPAPSLMTVVQVAEAMSLGNTQLFHFACHGDFDATNPDDSMLRLGSGSLTPSQIVGALRVGVTTSRPVIFLNACHTAESQFGWTGIGGWAVRFVNAGASAFIGSLWEVNDKLAAELALKFYGELLAGQTLGDAFHSARAHIRAQDDANPTWLAYTLYADPNGRVKPRDQ